MRDSSVFESAFKSIGYIEKTKVKCGKKNCRCSENDDYRHGPYFYYRYWKLIRNRYFQKRLYITYKQAYKIQRAKNTYMAMCEGVGGDYGNFVKERRVIRHMRAIKAPIETEQIKKTLIIKVQHLQ